MRAVLFAFFLSINTYFHADLLVLADDLSTIQRLRKFLLNDAVPKYQPRARPVKKHTTALNVSILFYIEKIDEWDIRTGTIRMDGEMILTWRDEHLNWNPDDFDGLDHLFFGTYEVWTPDITIWTSSDTERINRFMDYSTPVLVNASGHCEWWPLIAMTSHCTAKLTDFPFDKNDCVIRIGPNAHVVSEIKLDTNDHLFDAGYTDVKTDGFYGPRLAHPEYQVTDTAVSSTVIEDPPGYHWSIISIKMTIQRRSTLYSIYIGLPYITASAIQIAMFIFTHPGSFGRAILSSVSLLLLFIAAILTTAAIGYGALHSTDAPYAIKCTGVNILLVSLNLLISHISYTFWGQRKTFIFLDKVSLLWSNRYIHMIFCKVCTYSIDESPARVSVVSDRVRITDEDQLSTSESGKEDRSSSKNSPKPSEKALSSPACVLVDRIQLATYVIILTIYHS